MTNNINQKHTVTLTEGQIATILYVMEGYIQGNDEYEDRFKEDVDQIFNILEGTVDTWYEQNEPSIGRHRHEMVVGDFDPLHYVVR